MVEVVCDWGVYILIECVVCGIEILGGWVSGVVMECGLIGCDVVVLVGGVWFSLFVGNMGIEFL